jgi:antitoxin component of MazEF toxin-antitoxin module
MSQNKLPAERPATDLSTDDLNRVTAYAEAGLPGLAALEESTLYRMMEMYLSGSTYWQIQKALSLKRPLVLYVAHKYDWYGAKRDYLHELQEQIKGRVIDSKLVSQDFLLLLTQAWQKKISKSLTRYLATDDVAHTEEIDLKEVSQLLKTIEMINNLNGEGKDSKGRSPAVGLNLGDGVTIEKHGDNSVTITPKEKSLGEMLKKFADSRRAEEEQARSNKRSDIEDNKEEENKEGVSDENE